MEFDELAGIASAAAEGDEAAAAALVRATQADVWRLCGHLADRAAADDLTQETYLRAFRGLSRFAGRSSIRTWLLAIARRVCADHIRNLQRTPRRVTQPGQAIHSDDQMGLAETAFNLSPDISDHLTLRSLVAQLDSDRREAFVLTNIVGLSYAEAAEVCQCAVGTIRSRVARARSALIASLQDDRFVDRA